MTGDRFIFEDASRTTWENAVNSRDLLKPKPGERFLLVTSSFHMPRSMGAFRMAGFEVEAYPVDWRTRGWSDASQRFRSAEQRARARRCRHPRMDGLGDLLADGPEQRAVSGARDGGCDNAAAKDNCRPR